MSFLSNEGLEYFWGKLKSKFLSTSGGTIENEFNQSTKLSPAEIRLADPSNSGGSGLKASEFYVSGSLAQFLVKTFLYDTYIDFNNTIRIKVSYNAQNKIEFLSLIDYPNTKIILSGVGTPVEDYDVANKKYVDDAVANAGADVESITNDQIDAILAT